MFHCPRRGGLSRVIKGGNTRRNIKWESVDWARHVYGAEGGVDVWAKREAGGAEQSREAGRERRGSRVK